MLEHWLFFAALLLLAGLLIFHGLILLARPRVLTDVSDTTAEALGLGDLKPNNPVERRWKTLIASGLFLIAGVFLAANAVSWLRTAHRGDSLPGALIPPGAPPLNLLLLALLLLPAGLYLLIRAERAARQILAAIPGLLLVPSSTLRLWKWQVRLIGVVAVLLALILFSAWYSIMPA